MATRKSTKTTSRGKRTTTSRRSTRSSSTRRRSTARRKPANKQREINLAWLFSERFWGMLLLIVATYTFLSLLAPNQGQVTKWWLHILLPLFGVGTYLLPFLLAMWGFWLVRSTYDRAYFFPTRYFWSGLLGWLLFLAIASALADSGGASGHWLYVSLSANIGQVGFWALVFIAMLLLLAIFFQIGIHDLVSAWQEARQNKLEPLPTVKPRQPVRPKPKPSLLARWRERQHAKPSPAADIVINGAGVGQAANSSPRPVHVLGEREHPAESTAARAAAQPAPRTAGATAKQSPKQRPAPLPAIAWALPPIDDIFEDAAETEIGEEEILQRARIIEETLSAFGVPAKVVEANRGPAVTQYGVQPGYIERTDRKTGEIKRTKIKVAKIQSLSKDLALALSAAPIRIEAPIPGRALVGVEVPNRVTSTVSLRSMLESEQFRQKKGNLKITLGRDVSGSAYVTDLVKLPHLLIAGSTGSGKSVCVNSIISCLLTTHTPESLRMVMIDPKMVELVNYNGIPHLYGSVVTDVEKAVGIMKWAVRQMEERYRLLNKLKVRNLEAYNKLVEAERTKAAAQAVLSDRLPGAEEEHPPKPAFPYEKIPYIVIFIDELADLMMAAGADVEILLVRLAQMARATGIHLVMATQRPSVDVVTGLIKANFPARIAFNVTSQIDSRVILDVPGAEQLLGRGDMLFMSPVSSKLARLQGAFVSDAEINRLVTFWRQQVQSEMDTVAKQAAHDDGSPFHRQQPPLLEELIAEVENAQATKRDVLFDKAVEVVRAEGRASVSLLQRRLRVGYTRAGRLMDQMEEAGVVGPVQVGGRAREVYPPGREKPQTRPNADVAQDDDAPWY